jgi:hypothetical protein
MGLFLMQAHAVLAVFTPAHPVLSPLRSALKTSKRE